MQPYISIDCKLPQKYPFNDVAIAIDKSTDLVYMSYAFSSISIFSPSLDFLTTINTPYLSTPDCISVHEYSIYATDIESCVLIHFNEDTGFCECVNTGYLGSLSSLYALVYKFCVSVQGEVYVADTALNCIEVLDSNCMDSIRDITHPSLLNPHYIQVTEDGIYVILLGCREILYSRLKENLI